ncbi:SAV_915 family protein [Amycolatopsis sp. CA-230715]|uniref:SAV_915 family protein n=1 Tax=Amycolatopsis sp. CA-230715 TaxID=2745196 RepID=UPI001C020BC4|nr:SAV_915 family protein [Amycolatopsis sp. CA-230715]QWF85635.1 hypothetical protein HUW46_09090 [Amycolatopsis sp. CA-230715]
MASSSAWVHAATYLGPDTGSGPLTRFERDEVRPAPAPLPDYEPEAPVDPPPVLYVPCDRPASGGDVAVQTRVMRDGRTALLAYTALDRFTAHCGHQTPWVLVYTAKLGELDRVFPFDVLLLDVAVPHQYRTTAGTCQ